MKKFLAALFLLVGLQAASAQFIMPSGGGSATALGPFPVTVSGTVTSGGIPYFNSTTQMSSSAILGSTQVVLGGGAGAAPSSSSSLTYASGKLTVAGGTNTSVFASTGYSLTGTDATSMVDLAGTWNTSGTPTGIKLNITNTASNAASLLQDWQVGGSSKASVRVDGRITTVADVVAGQVYGTTLLQVNTSAGLLTINGDVVLARDAADTLAQRRTTNPQTFRVYNTYTNASNYSRTSFFFSGNDFVLRPQVEGTGTAGDFYIGPGGSTSLFLQTASTSQWRVSSTGHFLVATTTNTVDIGAAGNTTAPRSIYAATSINAGPVAATSQFGVGVVTSSITSGNAFVGSTYGANTFGPSLVLTKTRGVNPTSQTIVASGDTLLDVYGAGSDGSSYRLGGYIKLLVDGTPGASDMPGRWEFGVTPDGSATPATALTISASGSVQVVNSNNLTVGATTVNYQFLAGTTNVALGQDTKLAWGNNTNLASSSLDLFLARDAANVLAQRNSTTAQTFRIYGTTDVSTTNYDRVVITKVAGGAATIQTEAGGTGSAGSLVFGTAGTSRWAIGSAGNLTAGTDNTYDIGASGATRPRAIYAGSNIEVQVAAGYFGVISSGYYRWLGSSRLSAPSNGVILLSNDAITDFDRLQFGGTTPSFPALKRSTTTLEVKLADDSTYTQVAARGVIVAGAVPTLALAGGTCAGTVITGGSTAGLVTLTGACVATNTMTLSAMPAAPTGYICDAVDRTTGLVSLAQTSTSTTTAVFTFSATTGATDVIAYKCMAY